MPNVDTPAGQVCYTVKRGPPDGPTLVLVHGAGGSRLHWPAELRRMDGATVYTLDLPGHGRSDRRGCVAVGEYATAVVSLLDAVGVDEAAVVGHSMGGAVAQTLALEVPERVRALVLIATGARLRVSRAILESIEADLDGAAELITQYAWSSQADPSLRELGRETLQTTGADVLLGDFTACDEFDVMDRLADIEAPTLVINGTADMLTPLKYGRFLVEQIPRGRLVAIGGAGHMVVLEKPEEVADAIREFVAEVW